MNVIRNNNKYTFYKDEWSALVTKYANETNTNNKAFIGWCCVLAVNNHDLSKIYLLIDDKNNIVYDSKSIGNILNKIDMLKMIQD